MRQGEITERLDSHFHLPFFKNLVAFIQTSQYKPLGDVVTFSSEIWNQSTDTFGNEFPYIEISAIDIGSGEYEVEQVLLSEAPSRAKMIVRENNIIISTTRPHRGAIAKIKPEHDSYIASTGFSIISNINKTIDRDFLFYTLRSSLALDQFLQRSSGGNYPAITQDEIEKVLIPLPPLDVQKTLVAQMESARAMRQSKLAEAESLLTGIDQFVLDELGLKLPKEEKKQIFALKFSRMGKARIDPNFHHPDFYQLVRALQKVNTESLGNLIGFSSETWNPNEDKNATFRYIEISGVSTQTGEVTADEIPVSEAPSRARMIVKQGDILVSLTRPHRGAIAYLDKEFNNCIASTGFAVLRKITKEDVLTEYLWAILHNPVCLRQMLQRSSGGNYPAITDTELKQVLIPVPSLDIQKKIVSELHTRRTQARRLREEAESQWQSAKEKFEKALLG